MSSGFFMLWAGNSRSLYDRRDSMVLPPPGGGFRLCIRLWERDFLQPLFFCTGGMPMSKIDVSHVTFGYDGTFEPVFEDVSFQLDTDWRLGLIGRNGRGKTTLLRLLEGRYAYQGSIRASVPFAYFPFPVAQPQNKTEQVIESVCPGCESWEWMREMNLLGVDPDVAGRPFTSLSAGEQTKVLLAALFCGDHPFLLIDEPTNHLDAGARAAVGQYLRRKKGFILVSHDRELLDMCIDHILSINKTDITIQKGNFSSWLENKQRQDQYEQAENDRLRKDVRRLETAARRTADWSDQVEKTKKGSRNAGLRPDRGYIGHKAAKMMKRAQTIDARKQASLEKAKDLLKNTESANPLKLQPLETRAGRLVELSDVTIAYGSHVVCRGFSFSQEAGERIAVCGANGCGKSSLLRLICGEDVPYTGRISRMGGLKISYISQSAQSMTGTPVEYARQYRVEEEKFKAILCKMEVPPSVFFRPIQELSEGQKKKVMLARSLCEQAHLYVWDEPLNYLDVLSRVQIEQLLLENCPAMLFVEHDGTFCRRIATRMVSLEKE